MEKSIILRKQIENDNTCQCSYFLPSTSRGAVYRYFIYDVLRSFKEAARSAVLKSFDCSNAITHTVKKNGKHEEPAT